MRRAVLLILAVVGVVAAVVLVTGGTSDDGQSSDEALQDAQYRSIGAAGCMSPDVRRTYERLYGAYTTRFTQVVTRLRADADPASERRALERDRKFQAIASRLRDLIGEYSPGGSRYAKNCFDRAVRRFDRRFARQE